MMRLTRLFLAMAILVSTTGVTLTTRTCAKPSGKTTAACAACKKPSMKPKACCVVKATHLSVKSEFGKPAPVKADFSFILLPLLATSFLLVRRAVTTTIIPIPASPPRTPAEQCALFSTYRI
ncbi:MAG: hypothetical protein Q8922_07605 [Bacteroidota bacterium]|nr:hypothetical protein [Bacteroidota bacterium]MDP4233241.1 hypothetical protein [Bacteroidota bacterium]MDP4242139.1 hypothetical protein [Bacteroidota bacterium]MDP4287788.1 hypothetical protein [Bacteroidota bacterium]